jgi:CheY-like chemotaxis protein
LEKLREILLIDDDPVNNFINLKLIKNLEITELISVHTNGAAALEYLKPKQKSDFPELIILDMLMPVMDGKEFFQKALDMKLIDLNETVILLLAAHTKESDVEFFKERGVTNYTFKPLEEENIFEALKSNPEIYKKAAGSSR